MNPGNVEMTVCICFPVRSIGGQKEGKVASSIFGHDLRAKDNIDASETYLLTNWSHFPLKAL